MNRTRLIFFGVVGLAIIIVVISLVARSASSGPIAPPTSNEPLEVRVVVALPVESWVNEAATQFNSEDHKLEGRKMHVTIVAMDGLTALSRYDSASFDKQPTAWIPDSRYLVELANAAYKERLGRDVFLTDGEYRAKPIALSLFAWGIYGSRAKVLEAKFGEINWLKLHDAAITAGGWPELGGDPAWGFFKLVVPNPRKNVGGLAAMVAA
ncbi:MAG TPA: hypothetical protein VII92_17060, partial [Anaerolineae bacterium]